MKWQKLLNLVISFMAWNFVSLPVHEYGHWLSGTLTGIEMTVQYEGLGAHVDLVGDGAFTVWHYMAGGLFGGVIFGLLWWRARATPTLWDLDDEAALASIGLGQVGIAGAEVGAFLYGWPIILAENILGGLLMLGGLLLYLPALVRWLVKAGG